MQGARNKEGKDLPLRRKFRSRFLALRQLNPFVLIEVQDFHGTSVFMGEKFPWVDCVRGHAVDDRTSPHFPTPKKGNFQRTGQRLSAEIQNFGVNLRISETAEREKSPVFLGFFAILAGQNTETAPGSWRPSAVGTLLYLLSLLTGNFTGKNCKHRGFGRSRDFRKRRHYGTSELIPYSIEQGIIFADKGISAQEQRNFIGRN